MPYFSVVIPVYGCKTSLTELYIRLKKTLEQLNPDFEIIMVNDGSRNGHRKQSLNWHKRINELGELTSPETFTF